MSFNTLSPIHPINPISPLWIGKKYHTSTVNDSTSFNSITTKEMCLGVSITIFIVILVVVVILWFERGK